MDEIKAFERYPELAFLLRWIPFTPIVPFKNREGKYNALASHRKRSFSLFSDDIGEELKKWRTTLTLEGTELVYVWGLGFGYPYFVLKDWLKEKSNRALVFFEDRPAQLSAFLSMEQSEEFFSDFQVHFRPLFSPEAWEIAIEECARSFVSERVEVAALPSYAKAFPKKFQQLKQALLRRSTSHHAVMVEALSIDRLLENLAANLFFLPQAFSANALKGKFQGIPAVICGAGPSLKSCFDALKKLEHKALIFAGGSTIAALSYQGIFPHFAMAVDPNEEEFHRLCAQFAFEVPFLYANRLHFRAFSTTNGPLGYLRSGTGGSFEYWIEEKLGLKEDLIGADLHTEALSVTNLALSYAFHLGCNPIYLAGVDLAFIQSHQYAEGILSTPIIDRKKFLKNPRATDKLIIKRGRNRQRLYTLVKWVMEANTYSAYAKNHPQLSIYHSSEEGFPIPHIPYRPLSSLIDENPLKSADLRGRVYAECKNAEYTLKREEIVALLCEVQNSLFRSEVMWQKILVEINERKKESATVTLLELDLKEESAYAALLASAEIAFDQFTARNFPLLEPSSEAEKCQRLERKRAKGEYLLQLIRRLTAIIENKTFII